VLILTPGHNIRVVKLCVLKKAKRLKKNIANLANSSVIFVLKLLHNTSKAINSQNLLLQNCRSEKRTPNDEPGRFNSSKFIIRFSPDGSGQALFDINQPDTYFEK
jgi:hypothetical protein